MTILIVLAVITLIFIFASKDVLFKTEDKNMRDFELPKKPMTISELNRKLNQDWQTRKSLQKIGFKGDENAYIEEHIWGNKHDQQTIRTDNSAVISNMQKQINVLEDNLAIAKELLTEAREDVVNTLNEYENHPEYSHREEAIEHIKKKLAEIDEFLEVR